MVGDSVVAQLFPPLDEPLDYSSSMTRLLGATALVVAALTTLTLTGCAQEPEATVTPTPTPTPTPTETAEPASRPNPIFAIDCAGLLSLDEVQDRVTAPVSVKRDETNTPGAFWEIQWLQRGGLSCRWGGESRTDSSYDDGVDVLVLPNGIEEFTTQTENSVSLDVAVDGADSAVSQCSFGADPVAAGAPGLCIVSSLIGTTLVELRFSDSEGAYPTEQAIGEVAIGLIETVIARMVAAGPRQQEWTPPASSLQADDAFCTAAGADLLAEMSLSALFSAARPVTLFPGVTACEYYFRASDLNSVGIWIVENAAWAAAVPHTESPELRDVFQRQTTSSGAQWWLNASDYPVRGWAALGDSLIDVYVYGEDENVNVSNEQAQAAITAFMEQYAEVPPGM